MRISSNDLISVFAELSESLEFDRLYGVRRASRDHFGEVFSEYKWNSFTFYTVLFLKMSQEVTKIDVEELKKLMNKSNNLS